MTFRPPIFDRHGLALDPAQVPQTPTERHELLAVCCGVPVAEKTNPGDCALLRVGDHRHEREDDEDREPDLPHGHLGDGRLAGV